ncbi:MAG: hypothetical protein IJX81_01265 [Clostridia bacterium]|nr:hypothetical protein [Clostridia bacterium]
MPLFQPSNITPSSFAGIGSGVVAANENISISWQVNGNVPMTGFKIDIYQNNTRVGGMDNIVIPSPNKIYPTDNKGNQTYYVYEAESSWASWGIADGNSYTMQITQYWTENTMNDKSVQQVSQSAFLSRTKPILRITETNGNEIAEIVKTVSLPIIASYTQAQGDSIDWVRWQFYQISNNREKLLSDTGFINTVVLSFTAGNMQNGCIYKIVCTVQNENGVQVSNSVSFNVSYELPKIEGKFTLECSDRMSNLLSWEGLAENVGDNIQGVSNDGNYSFNGGNLALASGSTVAWREKNNGILNIPTDWTLAWKGISNGFRNYTTEETVEVEPTYKSSIDWKTYSAATGNTPSLGNTSHDLIYFDKVNNKYYFVWASNYLRYYNDLSSGDFSYTNAFIFNGNGTSDINDIAISPISNIMVVVGDNLNDADGGFDCSNAVIFTTSSSGVSIKENLPIENGALITDDEVFSAEFNQDGTLFAMASGEYPAKVFLYSFDGSKFSLLSSLQFSNGAYISNGCLSFNRDSSLLAFRYYLTNGKKNVVKVFKIENNALSLLYTIEENAGFRSIFNPKTDIFVTGEYVYKITKDECTYIGEYTFGDVYSNAKSFRPMGFDETGTTLFAANTSSHYKVYVAEIYFYGESFEIKSLKSELTDDVWAAMAGKYLFFYGNYATYTIENTFSIYKQFSVGTLFDASIKNITDGVIDPKIEYTTVGYTVSGSISTPKKINATVNASYLSGTNTALSETCVQLQDWLRVARENNALCLYVGSSLVGSVIIPQNINYALITISKDKVILSCDGAKQEISISTSTYPQNAISAIVLSGQQSCAWVYVSNGTVEISSDFEPTWDNNTRFLTHFNLKTLQAGQLSVSENKMDIYRENATTGELEKVYSAPKEITQIRDFGWITGEKYYYMGYALLDNAYTSVNPFAEIPVCKNQPYYLLLETTQDGEYPDVYHVVNYWRFGNNISAGSVSNNNTPNFLTNFTKYRLKQPVSRMGKSGTLTALLSNVIGGEYKDTATQMEDLYNISASENTFFLKDMKGNLYMVAVSNPITQTINTKSFVQEVTVSIPWEEVGSTEGVSIIQTPNDPNWVGNNDDLAKVAFSVDNATGMLSVEYPDGYSVTQFALNGERLVATTKGESQAPKLSLQNGSVKLKTEK